MNLTLATNMILWIKLWWCWYEENLFTICMILMNWHPHGITNDLIEKWTWMTENVWLDIETHIQTNPVYAAAYSISFLNFNWFYFHIRPIQFSDFSMKTYLILKRMRNIQKFIHQTICSNVHSTRMCSSITETIALNHQIISHKRSLYILIV